MAQIKDARVGRPSEPLQSKPPPPQAEILQSNPPPSGQKKNPIISSA